MPNDEKPDGEGSMDAIRFLSDPETAKYLAAQRGITEAEALARLRQIIEAIERQHKT